MKKPGWYTLSNGQRVRIVSAELVSEEVVSVTVEEDRHERAADS